MEGPYVVILVTAKDEDEAQRIGQELLDARLIACVNIVKGVRSLFWWQGNIDQASEALLVIKSHKGLLEEIIAKVKSAHSYDVPEVIALPVIGGNPDYLAWIEDEVKGRQKS